ncbi:hypothetical protein [Candidatus Sodalis pierantonius]|uniref:hypothetical protein n=1 Tax=Candidatus Sodalis pierantonii TaxID=1486991 RepID=UPI001F179260|nr:hypothetical protein [Candidatus Sodalis pierantonius]
MLGTIATATIVNVAMRDIMGAFGLGARAGVVAFDGVSGRHDRHHADDRLGA